MKRGIILALLLVLPVVAGAATPYKPKDPTVSVIGLMGSRAILRINGEQAMLGKGESRDGVTLKDIVAGEAVLQVGSREVRLGMGMDTGGISERAAGGSLELVMNRHGQFLTNGQINGRVVEFLVDTGANTVSMTAEDARSLGIDYKMDGVRSSSATAGGVVTSWIVMLQSVKVGPIVVKNVQATVREAPRISPVLLGMTFLSRVRMEHDQNKLKISER
ncbi:MAG TPA: retropepsin-like aspartic protease [Moraxellaceae bacterium]